MSDTTRRPTFLWLGKPVYRCRFCNYERVANEAAVVQHEATHGPNVRESVIVGPDSEPLLVAEETAPVVPVKASPKTDAKQKSRRARK